MKNVPRISVLTPTYNNENIIKAFLETLKSQNYPQNKIEILILDGGSTDNTLAIAKKYKVKIRHNPDRLAEPAITLGMSLATGDLMIILAVDNFLEDKESLMKIAKTFANKSIYAAFPKQDSTREDTIYTKYINTFTDPYNHFVYGDAANARTFHKIYKTIVHTNIYDVYDYLSCPDQPMIAFAQGFVIRGGYRRRKSDAFDDIRPIMDIIKKKKEIAYMYSVPLYHHTVHSMDHFFRKQRWATRNALEKKKYGIALRKQELSSAQQFRIKLWPLYALTFLPPLFVGIWNALREKQSIWLFHPIICFLSAYASVLEILLYNKSNKSPVSRQK